MSERIQEQLGADDATFGVELRTSWDTHEPDPDRYEITVWRGSHQRMGSSLGVSIGDLTKARAVAKYLYETLAPEHAEQARLDAIRHERIMTETHARNAERAAREKAAKAERRAKAKAQREAVRVEKSVCPECDTVLDADEFEQEVRECSRCGQTLIGEDARRCPDCNIFTARVGDLACPVCEQPLDGAPDTIEGVIVDGVFVSDAEIEGES